MNCCRKKIVPSLRIDRTVSIDGWMEQKEMDGMKMGQEKRAVPRLIPAGLCNHRGNGATSGISPLTIFRRPSSDCFTHELYRYVQYGLAT